MEDIYSGLIFQHALANILNLSQIFIKSLHQSTKQHRLVGRFTNIQKGNKEAYDSIDYFLRRLKDDIGKPILKRYFIEIPGMTAINDD